MIFPALTVTNVLACIPIAVSIIALVQSSRSIRLSKRAININSLPVLGVDFIETPGKLFETNIELFNVGKGTAFQIEIPRVISHVRDTFMPIDVMWELRLKSVPDRIEPNMRTRLRMEGYNHDTRTAENGAEIIAFFVGNGDKEMKMRVRFRDLTGRRYVTTIGVVKGLSENITRTREYTLFRAIGYHLADFAAWLRFRFIKFRRRNLTKTKQSGR